MALPLLGAIAFGFIGCRSAYHVVTAPVRVFHHPRQKEAMSDVVTPGTPIAPPTPTPLPRRVVERRTASPSPKPSESPHVDTPAVLFPSAKRVPDKPGYVFSPSDPTKYVDVSGYPSGSKVKDPYSGKIFLVP